MIMYNSNVRPAPVAIWSPAVPQVPRLGPAALPTPPASPISGTPTQVSIFQPGSTTATILTQAMQPTNYQEPQASLVIGSAIPAAIAAPAPAATPAPSTPFFSFLDLGSNTILILLVFAALLLAVLA